MFGIGLPEMILILALALIVVGPDKLPELARSVAKGVMELKKTAEGLKHSLNENGNLLDDIRPELEETAKTLEENILDSETYSWRDGIPPKESKHSANTASGIQPSHDPEDILPHNEDISMDRKENTNNKSTEEDSSVAKTVQVHNSVKEDLKAGPHS